MLRGRSWHVQANALARRRIVLVVLPPLTVLSLLQPILVNKLVFSKFPAMAPWYVRPVIGAFTSQVDKMWLDTQLKTHLAMIDGELQKSSTTWICGGEVPTAADFVRLSFAMAVAQTSD